MKGPLHNAQIWDHAQGCRNTRKFESPEFELTSLPCKLYHQYRPNFPGSELASKASIRKFRLLQNLIYNLVYKQHRGLKRLKYSACSCDVIFCWQCIVFFADSISIFCKNAFHEEPWWINSSCYTRKVQKLNDIIFKEHRLVDLHYHKKRGKLKIII